MEWTTSDGTRFLIVQHQISGLRARFTLPTDGTNIGRVYPKAHEVSSIDPLHPHDGGGRWAEFEGLGIGTRIYERGHALHPEVRWAAQLPKPPAVAVRRRLHTSNAFIWEASCEWCRDHGITEWREASLEDFAGHPGPAGV